MRTTVFATVALAATIVASAASALTSQQPANPGPVIPGVCTYNNARALGTSMVGQAVTARLQQISQAAEAELQPEGAAIQAEATALEQSRASLPQDQFTSRAQALNERLRAYQLLVQTRQAEIQYTEGLQLEQVAQTLDPILVQVYQERGCGLLLDRAGMYGANPAMDITDRVVEVLNTQLQTLTFDRSPLPQQPQ